jgi:hypothetical protein
MVKVEEAILGFGVHFHPLPPCSCSKGVYAKCVIALTLSPTYSTFFSPVRSLHQSVVITFDNVHQQYGRTTCSSR